jgi:type IV pilus modification protein PilV
MPTFFKAQNGQIGLWVPRALKPGAMPAERTYRQTNEPVFVSMRTFLTRQSHKPPSEKGRRSRLSGEGGFTLIEVLVAAVVLAIGLLGLLGLLDTAVKATASTRAREGATNLAREIIEDARTIPFAQVSPIDIVEKLQATNGLTNATPGPTWHIVRRGNNYTVAVHACYVDDPKDGLAKTAEIPSTELSYFCEEHKGNEEWKAGGAVDSTPIDFKRVTVDVTWSAIGRSPDVHQAQMISAAGEGIGLSASELKLVPPPSVYLGSSVTQPVITEAAKELTFSVTLPAGATAMRWSLEGVPQATIEAPTPKEGGTLTFKWPIEGLSDGTYQVSAQAISASGVLGPPVTIPVTLIRGAPAAPKGVKAGFNTVYEHGSPTKAVELQWEANSERNVIGYRVYNPLGVLESDLICPSGGKSTLSTALSCIELKTGFEPKSGLTYSLAALYRNAEGKVEEGAKASFTLAFPAPAAPNTPTGLEAKKEENGSVRLTWEAPSGGTKVAFYRIYRGSTDYTSRYDTASVVEKQKPGYTDSDAIEKHTYWVTAVSETMTESAFSNQVTE